MIIIYDTNKQFKYHYLYRRDYRKIENDFLINCLVALDYLYENDLLVVDYSKINKYKTNKKVNIIDKCF